jgi:hypothetical protein
MIIAINTILYYNNNGQANLIFSYYQSHINHKKVQKQCIVAHDHYIKLIITLALRNQLNDSIKYMELFFKKGVT